jgi:ATP-dependent exoDNAse (exonuclease V) beta subunit
VLGNEKKLLTDLWEKALSYQFITFNTIRKIIEINHWCENNLDNIYDMIFIDESQDFDNTMLKILLEDTTIPKLFVGDTRQAIYEWKGCINAFDKLPETSLILEFYSTFRVGEPACEEIRQKFNNCWMISKSNNDTHLKYDIIPDGKYVYLFRSWRSLMQTAQYIPNIWIHNFDSQIDYIKRLHSRLQKGYMDEDELNEYSDDLPKFLLKLSLEDLEKIINNMEKNLVDKKDSIVQLYTIHSYKGLEDNVIRIYNDIDINKENNLYYVALTRGKIDIILDQKIPIYNDNPQNKIQTNILNYGFNSSK